MTVDPFKSFDGSRLGAFVESRAKARNVVESCISITPIIFILPTVRQLERREWRVQGGGGLGYWTGPELSLAGPTRYDVDPGLWARELQELADALQADEDHNWANEGRPKPKYQISLWQPFHSNLGTRLAWPLGALPLRENDWIDSMSNGPPPPAGPEWLSADRVIPSVVDIVRRIPISGELLKAKKTFVQRVTEEELVPDGIETAMHTPDIGEPIVRGVDVYWRQQPSLADLFTQGMAGRAVACIQPDERIIEPPPSTRRIVGLWVYDYPDTPASRFLDPFMLNGTFRRDGEITPYDALKDRIRSHQPSVRCRGQNGECDDDSGDGTQRPRPVGGHLISPGEGRSWLKDLIGIINNVRHGKGFVP